MFSMGNNWQSMAVGGGLVAGAGLGYEAIKNHASQSNLTTGLEGAASIGALGAGAYMIKGAHDEGKEKGFYHENSVNGTPHEHLRVLLK